METIDEILILREMRGIKDIHGNPVPIFEDWANRIEAAAKRREDIALLRSALAPVLAIPTDALTGLWGVPLPDGGMMLTPEGVANAMRFVDAVREAQRIHNEEEDGE